MVNRFSFRMIRDANLADDITQEVFLDLYNQLKNKKEIHSMRSWLFRMAANKSINQLQKLGKIQLTETIAPFEQVIDPKLGDNLTHELNESIRQLNEQDQILVALYSFCLLNNYITDTIYHVTPEGKKPAFIFDLKDRLLPKHYQVEYCEGDFKRYFKKAAPYEHVNLVHHKNRVIIFQKKWSDDYQHSIFVHQIRENKTNGYKGPFVYDDLKSEQD